MAEIAFGASSVGVEALGILGSIIHITGKVRGFKRDCEEMRAIASTCQVVLQERSSATFDSNISTEFRDFLREILTFVALCKDANLVMRVWEVAYRRRLPTLKQRFTAWLAFLSAELTLASRESILKLIDAQRHGAVRQEEGFNAIQAAGQAKLKILDELKENQQGKKAGDLVVDFEESDLRLVLTSESESEMKGKLKLSEEKEVNVLCEPVKEELMRYGEKGPRHVVIYSRLSENTRVHPFYGIARRNGKRWTLFQDMSSCSTLAEVITAKGLPDTLAERLAIAQEIALTLDYLHSVEILVKRLSDRNVLLQEENGRLIPYLTNLESARLFKETSTGGGAYDVRYEAPEFRIPGVGRHSEYTDVWSLGLVIWQCVSSSLPFDIEHPVFDGQERDRVIKCVQEGQMPWKQFDLSGSSEIHKKTASVANVCCRKEPQGRMSAREVANALFDIITFEGMSIAHIQFADEKVEDRVQTLIQHSKNLKQKGVGQVAEGDRKLLYRLANDGNPRAAYLLGQAIFYELVPLIQDESEAVFSMVLLAGHSPNDELRCRASIHYFEIALQGGVKDAVRSLRVAHGKLSDMYRLQSEQDEKLKYP